MFPTSCRPSLPPLLTHYLMTSWDRSFDRFPYPYRYWTEWNRAYLEASFPRLVVRYEDLLFSPYEVARAVCGCLGGRVVARRDFVIPSAAVKASMPVMILQRTFVD